MRITKSSHEETYPSEPPLISRKRKVSPVVKLNLLNGAFAVQFWPGSAREQLKSFLPLISKLSDIVAPKTEVTFVLITALTMSW
jgi:hypothetical protein